MINIPVKNGCTGMTEEGYFDRIIQNEIHQTAPAVYEAAKRALADENGVYNASLVHEEEPHVNLGRALETVPSIDEDLQFRRPGGGGYIVHDGSNSEGTYCFIDARVKNSPKEQFSRERKMMAQRTLDALDESYTTGIRDGSFLLTPDGDEVIEEPEETAYYDPDEGDIYLQQGSMPRYDDPQIAGIGLAEVEIEDRWIQIGRVCIYPEISEEAAELDQEIRENLELEESRSLDERVEVPKYLDTVKADLEDRNTRSINAQEFLSSESIERGMELHQRTGYRSADPCF